MDERGGLDSESVQRAANMYGELRELYKKHSDQVHELHIAMVEEVPRQLPSMGSYDEEEVRIARKYVDDIGLIFRFLRRARFDKDIARSMLYTTLQWLLEGDIIDLATDLLHSPYMSRTKNGVPLFWIHSRFRDRMGRPCLLVRLQHVERAPDGLRELKANIIASMDVMRRYLRHVNRRCTKTAPVLQSVLLVDVSEAGIFNFELELLPFLVDLFKNHYPGLFGAVYVVNYGWLQSGLWRMLKPVLPPKLLARLMFVDEEEVKLHFDAAVPQSLGGALSTPVTPDSSDVFNYYARSAAWRSTEHEHEPVPTVLRMRTSDFDSIYDVMSRGGSVRRRPLTQPYASQAMTPLTSRTPTASVPNTPKTRASGSPQLVGRSVTFQAPERERFLAPPRRHQRQCSDPVNVGGTSRSEYTNPSLMQWIKNWMQPRSPPADPDGDIPRFELPQPIDAGENAAADHRDPDQVLASANTEQNTVTRYFSWRAHKYAQMDGHVSPYNIENPYFGYPASYVDHGEPPDAASTTSVVNVTDGSNQPGLSRQLRVRRRKRDLLRTLGYLFVLRLINLYHQARQTASVVFWMLVGHQNHERVSRIISRSLTRTTRDLRTSIARLTYEVRMHSLLIIGMLLALRLPPLRRAVAQRSRGVLT